MTSLSSIAVGGGPFERDIDPNASPSESIDSNTTPDTEFSPMGSPFQEVAVPKNKRFLAKKKLANLTQEEKVCSRYVIPSKGHKLTDTDFALDCCGLLEDKVDSGEGHPCSENE